MERYKLIKQFVDFIFAIVIFVVAFLIGQTVGKVKTESKYKSDYMSLSLKHDSIEVRIDSLKKTYKEIKASPCYKKYYNK